MTKAETRSDPTKPSGGDWTRWTLALLIALGAIGFFLYSITEQNVCQDVATDTGSVKLCGPPRLDDLAPFVLAISVLLWRDLSEFAVVGLVTLKRRVNEQETRQESLETRVAEVHGVLTQLAVAQSQVQTQSQANTPTFNFYPPDQEGVRRGITAKEDAVAESAANEPGGAPANERAELLGEFLQEYAALEPYIGTSGWWRNSRAQERLSGLTPDQRDEIALWNSLFQDEITAVRHTRNAAVHDPALLSTETIGGALENTRELRRILMKRLEELPTGSS